MKLNYVRYISDLHTFDNETTTLLKFFEISTEMQFVLFLLNERNIKTSLLMIHLKCTVAHYANLNSSGRRGVLIYVYSNEAFVKNFMKKLIF